MEVRLRGIFTRFVETRRMCVTAMSRERKKERDKIDSVAESLCESCY